MQLCLFFLIIYIDSSSGTLNYNSYDKIDGSTSILKFSNLNTL